MFEVEQKYEVADVDDLLRRLREGGADEGPTERHSDSYYNHPCRDFAESQEALRIRRIDGVPHITYKGKRLSGAIKARRELEWRLDPGDADGSRTEELLGILGFRFVATVEKVRRTFTIPSDPSHITIVVDKVSETGLFAEIELVVGDANGVQAARRRIGKLAQHLGLQRPEYRSYLRMLLDR